MRLEYLESSHKDMGVRRECMKKALELPLLTDGVWAFIPWWKADNFRLLSLSGREVFCPHI